MSESGSAQVRADQHLGVEVHSGVGMNATLMPGAFLDEGTWVAANTLVPSGEYETQTLVYTESKLCTKSHAEFSIILPSE